MTQNQRRIAGFAALFIVVEISLILFVDKPLSQWLRAFDLAHPDVINFFRAYTDIGKGQWYSWPAGIGGLLCAALYYRASLAVQARETVRWLGQSFALFFIAVTGAGLTADIFKLLFGRARPKLLKEADIYGFAPLNITGSDWHSFPSGHSTTIFAVACVLGITFPRWRWPLIMVAVAVGLSRIMINAHYAADVVAGAVLGSLFAYAVAQQFSRRGWVFRQNSFTLNDTGQRLCHFIKT